eukprot:TRINITY_DN26293_c0_g1_i1.p1 TRINITY_DN26293_c0_g1~~TRINITY_DN26293_c0_g1_i1.p1  ORF type:complete len:309 (+),score=52.09 TRINITY_DN26293_c0_g1_i1:210-1136(+)
MATTMLWCTHQDCIESKEIFQDFQALRVHARIAHPFPVVLMLGQSNIVGRGDPSTLPVPMVESAADHVRICFDLERHRPEEAHTGGWSALTVDLQVNPMFGPHFGPEWSMADRVRAGLGVEQIGVLKFAMGSSSMVIPRATGGECEWDPDGWVVPELVGWVREACDQLGPGAWLVGVYWNQGNSDLKVKQADGSLDLYSSRLGRLMAALREDLGEWHDGLPLVAHQVRKGSKAKTTKAVNAAIAESCSNLADAVCLELEGEAELIADDPFHFDGPTLLRLGVQAGDAMLGFQVACKGDCDQRNATATM